MRIKASLDLSSNVTKKTSIPRTKARLILGNITTVFPPNNRKIRGFKVATPSMIPLRPLASAPAQATEATPQLLKMLNPKEETEILKGQRLNIELAQLLKRITS